MAEKKAWLVWSMGKKCSVTFNDMVPDKLFVFDFIILKDTCEEGTYRE